MTGREPTLSAIEYLTLRNTRTGETQRLPLGEWEIAGRDALCDDLDVYVTAANKLATVLSECRDTITTHAPWLLPDVEEALGER